MPGIHAARFRLCSSIAPGYSMRFPEAAAHPVIVGPPAAGTINTDAPVVLNSLGSSPISMVWVIVCVLASAPFKVMNATDTALNERRPS